MSNTALHATDPRAWSPKELKALKRKLPTNWVDRVKTKVTFGSTKIREALSNPAKYDKEILDAAIEVLTEYKAEMEASIQEQKARLKQLGAL